MPARRIEHVNITVSDPDRTSRLLQALFDWHVRWSGPARSGGYSVHVGSEGHYIALFRAGPAAAPTAPFAKGRPLNHIGVEVDDLDAAEARVIAAGLQPFNHVDDEPGRRFYVFDPDGIEYELISYPKPG
jgi:catechol 2,3-dioxygenase-like lactoylglutathione lyase family enzyme